MLASWLYGRQSRGHPSIGPFEIGYSVIIVRSNDNHNKLRSLSLYFSSSIAGTNSPDGFMGAFTENHIEQNHPACSSRSLFSFGNPQIVIDHGMQTPHHEKLVSQVDDRVAFTVKRSLSNWSLLVRRWNRLERELPANLTRSHKQGCRQRTSPVSRNS